MAVFFDKRCGVFAQETQNIWHSIQETTSGKIFIQCLYKIQHVETLEQFNLIYSEIIVSAISSL